MKITVVVRTCNRPDYLKQALASIQLQTYQNWEVIIFDDSALDENFIIYKNFKCKNLDKRILYLTTNCAYDLFRNSWLISPDLSEGELLVRLDDDDLLVQDALEFINEIYETNSELDFSYGTGVFFRGDTLESIINTKNPFEHPKSKDIWAPYTIPNNKPWREPWTFFINYYDEPKNYTSIIHAAKANAFCIYHTYVMRKSSIKKVKDKITVTSKFVDDLEFLGSLDNLGLGYNTLKKVLCYVRIHDDGRVTDKDLVVDDTNMWQENLRIRDKVDELRPSGFISKIIPIQSEKNYNLGITNELQTEFSSYLNKINTIITN